MAERNHHLDAYTEVNVEAILAWAWEHRKIGMSLALESVTFRACGERSNYLESNDEPLKGPYWSAYYDVGSFSVFIFPAM